MTMNEKEPVGHILIDTGDFEHGTKEYHLDGNWEPVYTHPAPAVTQGEAVGEVDSTGMAVFWSNKPLNGSKLYTEPPAVAVNEQMLEALRAWQHYKNADGTYAETQQNYAVAAALTDNAIAAAEQMKGGV